MPWGAQCPNGGPAPFDPNAAVAAADFTQSVFVLTNGNPNNNDLRRSAYTYVTVQDANGDNWRVCVCGHAHFDDASQTWVPGNTFIPGWDAWQVATSAAQTLQIAGLADHGVFPGDARYPARV